MKSNKNFRVYAFLTCLIFSCTANGADHSRLSTEQANVLGRVTGDFLQLSFMLQYVTSERCNKYARNRHLAQKDLDESVDHIQQLTNAKRSDVARQVNLWLPERLDIARKDIDQILATNPEKSLEFQCGMLLGVTSVHYARARGIWVGFFRLNEKLRGWHSFI